MLDLTQYYPCYVKEKDSGWEYLSQLCSDKQNILFVTTKGFIKRSVLEKIKPFLRSSTLAIEIVDSNPELQNINEMHQKYRDKKIDLVIGMGGGSVLDASKVLSVLLAEKNKNASLIDILRNNKPFAKQRLCLFLIPTTAGTGAEVTPFATIWDRELVKKRSFASSALIPDCVNLDPRLTLSVPIDITIDCALDACSHAMETLWNKNATDDSIALANEALRLFANALPQILRNPQDLTARAIMQKGSLVAGLAIGISKSAIAHSISYPLTLHFGVPHGLACSFTLPRLANLITKSNAWVKGADLNAIDTALSVMEKINVQDRIKKYCSYEQIISVCEEMNTKGRSENFVLNNFNPKQIFLTH